MNFNIIIISCTDLYNGYSKNGVLPWKNYSEMSFFKSKTRFQNIIIGYNTFNSLPHNSFIRTKFNNNPSSVIIFENKDNFDISKLFGKYYLIGGIKCIDFFIEKYPDVISKVYLSKILKDYNCDMFFPKSFLEFFEKNFNSRIDNKSDYVLTTFYKKFHEEYQYLNLMSEIISKNSFVENRTGITACSIFGRSMKFDLRNGFPLLTTKKVLFNQILEELLFFISGSTNTKILESKNVKIWSGNTSRVFLDNLGLVNYPEGDQGPMYGFQWRHAGMDYINCLEDYSGKGIDQLKNVIKLINEDPFSRRILIVNLDTRQQSKMVLAPCHCLVQFYVENEFVDLSLYQRSGDLFLGIPYNIASYSLLLLFICNIVGKKPRYFTHFLGDVHIYSNHVSQCMLQMSRIPYKFPNIRLDKKYENIDDINSNSVILENYEHHPYIKAPMAV